MSARIGAARKKAIEVLEKSEVKKAPVPVKDVARELDVTVRYEPFSGELSGMLLREDGRTIIGVNALHSVTRKRFTIAHEIGHLVLHRGDKMHIDSKFPIALRNETSSLAVEDEEIEANQFAAELLMPRVFLIRDIQELPEGLEVDEAINRLAELYEVSVQAMTIRLTSLGFLK